jgi:hypothetical protein
MVMQGNKLLAKLTGLALLCAASSTFAVMSLPYGWYIEGNLGSSHASNTDYPGSSSSSGLGGNANLGYKFMPFFGTEIGYTQYANTSIKNNAGTKAATVKNYSYDLSGKGILPVGSSPFELFAKLGVARVNAKTSINSSSAAAGLGLTSSNHSTTGLYYGIGAGYSLINAVQLTAQWQRAQGKSTTGNHDLFSAGVTLIFG